MADEPRHKRELLLKLFFAHSAAEIAGDVDGVMATLSENPKFEWYPVGYRAEGRVAVREFYSRALSKLGGLRIGRESGSLGNLDCRGDVLWMGTDSLVTRDDLFLTDAAGVEHSLRHLSIFTLDGYLLQGEIIFTTALGGQLMKNSLGSDFINVPGVSIIE